MPAFRLILLFLLAAFSASAQEQQQAAEPQELPAEVAAEFDAEGITIPFPQHDVHVVKT